MIRLRKTCLLIAVATASVSSCWAQDTGAHTLWAVYLSAGVSATKAKNWPEAEMLYTAAIKQAEADQPSEPYLMIAQYSLGTIYWEQGKQEESSKVFGELKLTLEPAAVRPDLRESADVLTSIGNTFYSEAEAENKDATDKKLAGDALTTARNDANQKYRFARRYFEWATVVDKHFLPSRSPELENVIGDLALAAFQIGDYSEAIPSLVELKEIIETTMQRDNALLSASLAYSLASKETADKAKSPLSVAAIALYLGLSYEAVADSLTADSPEKAVQTFEQGEQYLSASASDQAFGKTVRIVLARVYDEHAQILRRLKKPVEADKLESQAKAVRSKDA